MQVKINRCVMLGGKEYAKGVHDVTVPDGERWFFDALLADGQIEAAETPQGAPKEPEAKPAAPEAEKPRKTRKKAD